MSVLCKKRKKGKEKRKRNGNTKTTTMTHVDGVREQSCSRGSVGPVEHAFLVRDERHAVRQSIGVRQSPRLATEWGLDQSVVFLREICRRERVIVVVRRMSPGIGQF